MGVEWRDINYVFCTYTSLGTGALRCSGQYTIIFSREGLFKGCT